MLTLAPGAKEATCCMWPWSQLPSLPVMYLHSQTMLELWHMSVSTTVCVHEALVAFNSFCIKCTCQQWDWHAGTGLAATPSSEVSASGTDRRGRQKITWQPPTASQREDAAQVSLISCSCCFPATCWSRHAYCEQCAIKLAAKLLAKAIHPKASELLVTFWAASPALPDLP